MNDNYEMNDIDRILRVDHAGEYGAIHIYQAQLWVARWLYHDIVDTLDDMLSHEKNHYQRFDDLLQRRRIRHCYAIHLWALGGWLLGLVTAALGRNAIFVCTYSIESTVLQHLDHQLQYLQQHDSEAYAAVLSIKADEEAHQALGQRFGSSSILYKPLFYIVNQATTFAIWLSTKL